MVSNSLKLRKTSNRFLSAVIFFYYLLEGIVLAFVPESWKQKDVKGQVVLITGGGSGIGQLMAVKFAKLGAKVVLWDINEGGMKRTTEIIQENQVNTDNQCFSYQINICDSKAVYDTAKLVREEVGPVDILINNAGVVSGQNLLDLTDEKINLTMSVNTLSHFYTVKAFLPEMVQRKQGHIVTIASVAGNAGCCAMSDYCASKFANVGFDLSLRMELAQADLHGIKTSIVKPYFITTGMFSGVHTDLIPFLKPKYVAAKIVKGILAETTEIVIPYYFAFLFWLLMVVPSKCLVPMFDLLGGFEFMVHFQGREKVMSQGEINNNAFNNNSETCSKTTTNMYNEQDDNNHATTVIGDKKKNH